MADNQLIANEDPTHQLPSHLIARDLRTRDVLPGQIWEPKWFYLYPLFFLSPTFYVLIKCRLETPIQIQELR